jgi:DNA polymerase-1
LECRACPLDKVKGGKIAATGSLDPLIYILGESPESSDTELQEQFTGEAGELLRKHIPHQFKNRLRWNNVVRSRVPNHAAPEQIMVECCKPSVVADVEKTRPKAIFGFGGIVLNWASEFSGVMIWRGRKMPVKIGNHVCWYYPMCHPGYLLKQRRGGSPSEEERMFRFDLERAFAEIEGLPEAVVHTSADVRLGVETTSHDVKHVREALEWAAQQPVIGIDLETNGLRPYAAGAKILSAAVGTGDRAFAFALDHPEAEWSKGDRALVGDLWKQFLLNAKGIKVAHMLSFELEWSGFFFGGRKTIRAGQWGDTAVQAVILDERRGKQRPGPLSLEFLVQQYFGFNLKNLAGVDRKNLENTPIEAVLQYNAPDARYAALLYEKQRALIEQEGLEEAYELGLRRVPTCVLTQAKGVPVDQVEVKRLQKKYAAQIQETEQEIALLSVVREFQKKTNGQFNPLSNPDVIKILKDFLHRTEILVVDKFTKKQKYSADEAVLTSIDHPLAELLVKLRKVNKQKSTYVDPLEARVEGSLVYPDGFIHAQFNTIFAETGRLSCADPNLQNFPKRGAAAKEVRKQLIAPPGCVMLAFDLGQIEARVIAMFTKDPRFCKALWENYDVHMEWAERLAHAYPARVGGKKFLTDKGVMGEFRNDVKNQFTFPLFFGAKLESAAGFLKIPVETFKPLYREFWRQFSGVKKWQERQIEFYNEKGFVACLTGRRRRGPLSVNQILNSAVQGTAAELILASMSRLSEIGDPLLQPEINIHDDLTYVRVPKDKVDYVAENVITEMLRPAYDWINVPLTVEMAIGADWLQLAEKEAKAGKFSSDKWFA